MPAPLPPSCSALDGDASVPGSDAPLDRIEPGRSQPLGKIAPRLARQIAILRPDDKIGAVPPVPEERVAADRHTRMRLLGFAKEVGDLALRRPRTDRHRDHRTPALEL